ncbi:hypothetical protein [Limosilactobacillus reuteri]|uniref:hypothetical protein n=2 Tax=Limosilactobacillus reuteri TaxID=1598 RepID=UPI000A1EFD3B|nr:hypothetical protein [Limosilactobacillus reuteri]
MVRKIIDMSMLDKLKIDGEVANYLVQWDNTLLLTAYDQNRTFVLTADGEQLLIRERLKDVLSRFAQTNLIYYMVHLMEDASELESDKRIEMIMNGREGDKYHIQIATSERTFRRIVSAADEVAKEQLSLFEYWMYRLGKVKREIFERTYFGDYCVYTKLRKLALDLFIQTVLHILNKAHKKVYGEETPAELVKEVKRVINKF